MRDIAAQWGQPGFCGKARAIEVMDALGSVSTTNDQDCLRELRARIEELP